MRINLAIQSAAAFIVGIYITFSQIHNASLGNHALSFLSTAFAVTATLELISSKKSSSAKSQSFAASRIFLFGTLATAAISISLEPSEATVVWFLVLVSVFAGVNGLLEVRKSRTSKDARLSAIIHFGLIAALAVSTALTGLDQVAFVGFFGAYAAIFGVHLGISAASPNGKSSASPKA